MSQQIVEQVKADLVNRGIIPADASGETDNRVPFLITREVAERTGGMLFVKNPSQNGYTYLGVRYSHDAIAYASGWADCLVNAGPPSNGNKPGWGWTPGAVSGVLAAPPAYAGPQITVPTPPVDEPTKPDVPVVPTGIEARLQAVESGLSRLAAALVVLAKAINETNALPVFVNSPVYDIPYEVKAPWPIGTLKGSFTATPRKA